MAPTHQYFKAPIIEAALAFQVAPHPATKPEIFEQFAESQAWGYPTKHPVFQRNWVINLGPEPAKDVPASSTMAGFRLVNKDQKQVAIVNEMGLVFSRLTPYEGWHVFKPEAQRLWKAYIDLTGGLKLARVGLRYINRIDIPMPVEDLQDYLPMTPGTDPKIGLGLQNLFSQVHIRQPEFNGSVAITHALVEPPPVPGKGSFILDIDTFRDADVPESEDNLWELIEVFHTRKNEVFEASITDKVRELIQ